MPDFPQVPRDRAPTRIRSSQRFRESSSQETKEPQPQRDRRANRSKSNEGELKLHLEEDQEIACKNQPYPAFGFNSRAAVTQRMQLQPVTILPRLKLKEFAGDFLEWPKRPSLFNAVIANAPIDDITTMSQLETLIKDKVKASIAGFSQSRALYHMASQTSTELWKVGRKLPNEAG